jgi:hypothetical protein
LAVIPNPVLQTGRRPDDLTLTGNQASLPQPETPFTLDYEIEFILVIMDVGRLSLAGTKAIYAQQQRIASEESRFEEFFFCFTHMIGYLFYQVHRVSSHSIPFSLTSQI